MTAYHCWMTYHVIDRAKTDEKLTEFPLADTDEKCVAYLTGMQSFFSMML